jgi:hypothetical protein
MRVAATALFAVIAVACLGLSGCGARPAKTADDDAANHARSQVERGPIRVTAEVSPARPRLSDSPTLTLTIDHEEGVTVEKPQFADKVGKFIIKDCREPLPKTDNGRVVDQQVLTLEPTEAGRLRIDPIAVAYTDRRPDADGREKTVETGPLSVEVTSLVGDKTPTLAELHPPAAPVELSSPLAPWVWTGVVVAICAVAAIAWLKRRRGRKAAVAARPLTAEELANLELDRLVESDLANRDVKLFYVELTAIVRRYIERTTRVRAPEQTTEEFLREISRAKTFNEDVRLRLRDFLEAADLVKFAAHCPRPEDVDESVRRARLFIGTKKTES